MGLKEKEIADSLNFLKAISDETRLKIILNLINGKKTVNEIVEIVKKAQPTISLNLKLLENALIVEKEKQGKFVFYRINDFNKSKLLEILDVLKIR